MCPSKRSILLSVGCPSRYYSREFSNLIMAKATVVLDDATTVNNKGTYHDDDESDLQ
jgi:hypothetical protein